MKFLVGLLFFSVSLGAYANPGVTKNTDLGKKKVTSHKQVTRCSGEKCTVNSVTTFDKELKEANAYADCTISQKGVKRFQQCDTYKKKKKAKVKPKVITKTKVVTKKNRLSVHIGGGPNGLEQTSYNNTTSVKESRKAYAGLQYQRMLNDELSVGASIFTNKSGTFSIGIDY